MTESTESPIFGQAKCPKCGATYPCTVIDMAEHRCLTNPKKEMTYPEQLKQMSNKELIQEFYRYNMPDCWDASKLRLIESELLRRMEQPPQEHLKETIYLLRKNQPNNCSKWEEDIGDCKNTNCEFCRIENHIDELERNFKRPSQEHLKEALEEIINFYQHNIEEYSQKYSSNTYWEIAARKISEIATKALKS